MVVRLKAQCAVKRDRAGLVEAEVRLIAARRR
jgi:hypothetical protein